jgi:antitoxin ParD1/3/4
MRTNIDIDDAVLAAAMQSGAYKTKKEVVEAGLRLVARQAAYREILRWEGKLHWDGDDFSAAPPASAPHPGPGSAAQAAPQVQEPTAIAGRGRHAGR